MCPFFWTSPCLLRLVRPAIGILINHFYKLLKLKSNLLRSFCNFSNSRWYCFERQVYFCRVLSEKGDQSLTIFTYYIVVQLLHSPTVEWPHTVVSLCNHIKALGMSKVSKSMLWSRIFFHYEYANKLHKMLVRRLKPCPFLSTPAFQLQPDCFPTYCPHTMSKVVCYFLS